jgi:WD40 repeat protein
MINAEFSYDGFASHATDPDGALVRSVEARLETFHTRYAIAQKYKHEIELCVDGRDFVFSRRSREAKDTEGAIESIVRNYQAQCRALVVFCGPSSRNHPWISKEIDWWSEIRPDGPVYFALTHGHDPSNSPANMPEALLRRGGGDNIIFFDLRGYYRRRRALWQSLIRPDPALTRTLRAESAGWRSVRDFDQEVGKLAARLTCDALGEDASLDTIEDSYVASIKKERLWRRAAYSIASVAIAIAVGLAVYWAFSALQEQQHARVSTWIQQAEALSETNGPNLIDALAFAASAVDDGSDSRAARALYRVLWRLAPIERTLTTGLAPRASEQTQTAALVGKGRFLATGGRDSTLHLLDVEGGGEMAQLPLNAGRIRTIAPTADGFVLLIGTDRGLRLVRLDVGPSGRYTFRLDANALTSERIGGVSVDEKRGLAIAGTFSGQVVAVPLAPENGQWPVRTLTTILDPRYAAKGDTDVFSGIFGVQVRGDRVVVAGIDGVLTVLEWRDARLLQSWQKLHPHSIFALDVTRDGRAIAVADADGRLWIYDSETGTSREAQFRAIDTASIARTINGDWAVARADELAAVGVAFDPTGTLIAVTSHDRTVKFLLTRDLLPLSIAVHSAVTRGVVFDQKSGDAYTYGDDGVITVVRPLATPLAAEFSKIAGVLVPFGGQPIVLWPQPVAGVTKLFSFDATPPTTLRQLGSVDVDVSTGMVADNNRLFLRAAASTRVKVVDTQGAPITCTELAHSNERDDVEIVETVQPGRKPGEIITLARRNGDGGGTVVRGWSSSTCKSNWRLPVAAPPSLVSVTSSAILAVESGRRVVVRNPEATNTNQSVDFAGDVASVAALPGEARFLALTKGSLCVCSAMNAAGGFNSTSGNCAVQSTSHACTEADVRRGAAPLPFRRLFSSPSRRHVVATGDYGAIWLVSPAANFQIYKLSSGQLRPGEPPFAFDPEEDVIAVPTGDTGIGIFSTATGTANAQLPTPSRVIQLAFATDGSKRLLSIDGGVLRIWDWSPIVLLREACKRWPKDTSVSGARARSELCGR